MAHTPLVLLAGVLAAALLILDTIRKSRALKDFDGAWSSQFSRLWLFRAHISGRMHEIFTAANTKYGDTVRIAPYVLLTRDLDLVRKMNAVRSPYRRSEWYITLQLYPGRDNVASVRDEDLHHRLKQKMLPGTSGRDGVRMEDAVDSCLEQYLTLIQNKYLSTQQGRFIPLDLAAISSYFTLDVISEVGFSGTFGFLRHDKDLFSYNRKLHEFIPVMVMTAVFTELPHIMQLPLLHRFMPKATDKDGLGRLMGITEEHIATRLTTDDGKNEAKQDFIQSFIKHGIDQEQLKSDLMALVVAGSESTASALHSIVHFVSHSPRVLQRLLNEAKDAMTSGNVTRPIIRDNEAKQLPYLQACIKEGLRMKPPIHGLQAKMVPPEGADIHGKHAPPGTWIAFNTYGLMRDQSIFEDSAEIFLPDRWLSDDSGEGEARLQHMNAAVDMIWGHGRYGCLGRKLAMMELNKGVFETLFNFNIESVNIGRPFTEQYVGFVIHSAMLVRVTKREGELDMTSS